MATKNELRAIAKTRLKESKELYSKGLYDGALYLAGYVVETALKACICKLLKVSEYPDRGELGRVFKSHKIDDLIFLAGLKAKLDEELNLHIDFEANWTLTTTWSETFRYKPIGTATQMQVLNFINALEDPTYGIFTWLKKRW